MAVERNINVQKARLDHEKTGFEVDETRSALLPAIGIDGSFQDNLKLPVTLLPGEIVNSPGTTIAAEMGTQFNTAASIRISQALFDQTAIRALQISQKMQSLAALNIEKASEELAFEVSKLYFLALTSAKQKALTEENTARIKRQRDIIKMLVDNGMGKQVDYERISVTLENSYTQFSNTAAALEQQLNLMKYMLEIPAGEAIVLTDTADVPLLRQTPVPVADFSGHVDIRMLESQQEIDRLNQKKTAAGYLPTLSFTGQYGYQGFREKFGNYFRGNPENKWYSSSFIGLSLSIPVFDGWEKRSRSGQAQLAYQVTGMTLDNTRDRFGVDYRNAWNNYQNHKDNVQRQTRNIALAEKVYRETALKYREGLATMSDLLQDEMSLSSAQSGYLNALYNFRESELKIMSLNGEIRNLFNP